MKINEAINEMRQRGYEDNEITEILQEQGISPREINEAMSQSTIKQAVSEEEDETMNEDETNISETTDDGEMMPSIMDSEPDQQEQMPQQEQQDTNYDYGQSMPSSYGGYPDEDYGEDYSQGVGINTDTISEIVEQNVTEKISKILTVLNSLSESKVELNAKVEKMDERLTRIEGIIDQLQMSLIRKAGEQEQNIEDIKTEIKDINEGFGKVINPLIDGIRTIEKKKPKESSEKITKKYSRKEIKKR